MQKQNQNHTNPFIEQMNASVVPVATVSFQFQNCPVRIALIDGTEFFIARDVTQVLGFQNSRQAVRTHVSKKDRKAVHGVDTPGGKQTLLAVNESGLYALIFGSTLPEARKFKDWVTSEVLPSLRRTGQYQMEGQLPLLLWKVTAMLRGRGAAKERQVNRIIAHRPGDFSFRIGKRWVRHVENPDVVGVPLSHSIREGLALSAIRVLKKSDPKSLIQ